MIGSQRVSYALEQMETIFPGMRQYFEGGSSKAWDEDPWALAVHILDAQQNRETLGGIGRQRGLTTVSSSMGRTASGTIADIPAPSAQAPDAKARRAHR